MRISILTSDDSHPVVQPLRSWCTKMQQAGHVASLAFDKSELVGGDLLFLVSCAQIVGDVERQRFRATLVVHASDLPRGRGWSPHIWAIIGGAQRIPVCLLDAREPVDSGDIWLRTTFDLGGHELLPEINEKLFAAELALMSEGVERFHALSPIAQSGDPGPYLPRRTPLDSRLDPDATIAAQFDLLRVVDNNRYPAFFEHRGARYVLKIEKA